MILATYVNIYWISLLRAHERPAVGFKRFTNAILLGLARGL